MRTQKQIEASRANGRKSRGPMTAAGKRNSAANSRKHGLFAANFVWKPDDRTDFEIFHARYTASMGPANPEERDAVERIARLAAQLACANRESNRYLEAVLEKRPKASVAACEIMSRIEFRLQNELGRAFSDWVRLRRSNTAKIPERTQQVAQSTATAAGIGHAVPPQHRCSSVFIRGQFERKHPHPTSSVDRRTSLPSVGIIVTLKGQPDFHDHRFGPVETVTVLRQRPSNETESI